MNLRSRWTHAAAILAGALLLTVLLSTGGPAQTHSVDFDHDQTRFPLYGSHERTPCESCHVGGRFEGTPSDCSYCHDGTNKWAVTAKHSGHLPTTEDCGVCHTERSWLPARMDHANTSERCESCHMGTFAEGKPPGHPRTSDSCGDCHQTMVWASARFDHSNIFDGCFTCHNGLDATGKDQGHVQSSNECQDCHSTRRWVPAGFNHDGIVDGCFTCHDGDPARPKDPDHVPSSNECQVCHVTNRWVPADFDHANVTGACSSCHNGTFAEGPDQGHFITALDCDTCHSTANWLNPRYTHTGAYPGDHRRNLACTDCHTGNSEVVTYASPAYQPDCAGCHARDYEPDVDRHGNRNVSENRDCSGSGCHSVRDDEW